VTDTRPEFMPAQFVEWADEHRELLDRVVWVLARNGIWPLLTDLTRDFVRLGKPTPVEAIFFDMPQPLRFRTGHPERAVLSLFGLRLTEGGGPFLAGFYETLALARGRFEADGQPILTSQDVWQLAVLSKAHPSALIEIVEREAPFLLWDTQHVTSEGRRHHQALRASNRRPARPLGRLGRDLRRAEVGGDPRRRLPRRVGARGLGREAGGASR
jgi:hypothetical protein